MAFLSQSERRCAQAVSGLVYCNPFWPERIDHERQALGAEFVEAGSDWNIRVESEGRHPNIERLRSQAEALIERLRQRLIEGAKTAQEELVLYEDVVLFVLYHRYYEGLQKTLTDALKQEGKQKRVGFYTSFHRDLEHFLAISGVTLPTRYEPAHIFACSFQLRRAFHHIFSNIVGISKPVVDLRARVWQSIFTHDMRRYRRMLYDRMGEITCLITGPSGTGKELVARAIGLSRYIPFDPKTETFLEDFAGSFYTLNLSALSPTLIESELFGHKRGAFTGALQDKVGWFEVCPPLGTVFLDEIGEIDPAIQVKLLRTLQTRSFQRLGETQDRRFQGKVIAATNRDLDGEMQKGRFREDLYYRLCSDMIATPCLRERLRDCPEDLEHLLKFIAHRIVGPDEAEQLTKEAQSWIAGHMADGYAWPGNVRELEQCVRNIMVRRSYHPTRTTKPPAREALAAAVGEGSLTIDDLLRQYCSLVYAQTGNYQETARRLNVDHRTVKSRIDEELVDQFRTAGASQ